MDIEADNQYVKDDLEYSLVDELVAINILENDVFGKALHQTTIIQQPSNGILIPIPNPINGQPLEGEYIYQPNAGFSGCLLYTSPSPRDATLSRMPSSA